MAFLSVVPLNIVRAVLDWNRLRFEINGIDGHVKQKHRNGRWRGLNCIRGDRITLSVGASVLAYAPEIFEGLRCFEWNDGTRRIFRPRECAKRFNQSAKIMCLPEYPENYFLRALVKTADSNIRLQPPSSSQASLYLRPLLFASSSQLGVRPADEHTFLCYGTPVGPYFPQGFTSTIRLFLTPYDRVSPQGVGLAKAGANYAISIRALVDAKARGFEAPLFTDPLEHDIILETHATNVGFVIDGVLVTPAQNPMILESGTRLAVHQICEDLNIPHSEQLLRLRDIKTATEAMVFGTGANIGPIGSIYAESGPVWEAADCFRPGPMSTRLYNHLTGIQRGSIPDDHGWMWPISEN